MKERIRLELTIYCGKETCASKPGHLCRYARWNTSRGVAKCELFRVQLREQGGWFLRCDSCVMATV